MLLVSWDPAPAANRITPLCSRNLLVNFVKSKLSLPRHYYALIALYPIIYKEMSLQNYLDRASGFLTEIQSNIQREEAELLYNRLKEIGYDQYLAFVEANQTDILKYLSLSPSQRRQKKWLNHPDILLIQLAAIQISYSTDVLLKGIAMLSLDVETGVSYRYFHAKVAEHLLDRILYLPFSRFSVNGENPFSPFDQ